MQITLNAVDVFNAAIMLEERGARFYADAAAGASGDAKKLLIKLAEMETGHAKYFRQILADFTVSPTSPRQDKSGKSTKSQYSEKYAESEDAKDSTSLEEAEETEAFLQALTSDKIITSRCQVESGDTYCEILEKAMLIEKNSVFFYTTVKRALLEGIAAADVDRLISEEVWHFKMLSDALVAWRNRSKIK